MDWNRYNVKVGDLLASKEWGDEYVINRVTLTGFYVLDKVFYSFEQINREGTNLKIVSKKLMKTYEVDEEFIKQAHSAACGDWKRRLEAKFPEVFSKTYRIGDRFLDVNDDDQEYLLVKVDHNLVSLINLSNGRSYDGRNYTVVSTDNITEKEFDRITSGDSKDFKLKQ